MWGLGAAGGIYTKATCQENAAICDQCEPGSRRTWPLLRKPEPSRTVFRKPVLLQWIFRDRVLKCTGLHLTESLGMLKAATGRCPRLAWYGESTWGYCGH